MNRDVVSDKLELAELANKLFMYCDAQQWQRLLDEVFIPKIWFDMSSAGGHKPQAIDAKDICRMWADGFAGLDAIHHQAGHYLINVSVDQADIFAYAVATHYKKYATKGAVRSFVGSYDLKAEFTDKGWRLSQFKYNLKYIDGNVSLE